MIVAHFVAGGLLKAVCGQNVARPGHTGWHTLELCSSDVGHYVACGDCWEWLRRYDLPKHNAGRDSAQARVREGIESLYLKLTGHPREGRHCADRKAVA